MDEWLSEEEFPVYILKEVFDNWEHRPLALKEEVMEYFSNPDEVFAATLADWHKQHKNWDDEDSQSNPNYHNER